MSADPIRLLPAPELPAWVEEAADEQESIRREREAWTGRRDTGWSSVGDSLAQLVAHDFKPPHKKARSKAEKLAFADYLRDNMTTAELALWAWLQEFELDFEPQVVVAGWIVDFFSANLGLVIEVDGSAHKPEHRRQQDFERTRSLESKGFHVVRITNRDVLSRRFGYLLDAMNGEF
jgi:very-short-patch-repair endonuclease